MLHKKPRRWDGEYGKKITGTSFALFIAAIDLFDIELLPLAEVFCLALFHHSDRIKMFLIFQCQYCFRCGKPTVKQYILGSDTCLPCRMDQLHHYVRGFVP